MFAGCALSRQAVEEQRVPEFEIVKAVVCVEEPEGRKYTEHNGNILPNSRFWIFYEIKGLSISDAQTVHLKGEVSISDESGFYNESELFDEIISVNTDFTTPYGGLKLNVNIKGNGYLVMRMWSGTSPNKYLWKFKLIDVTTGKEEVYEQPFTVGYQSA
jgi:hypothetical protein